MTFYSLSYRFPRYSNGQYSLKLTIFIFECLRISFKYQAKLGTNKKKDDCGLPQPSCAPLPQKDVEGGVPDGRHLSHHYVLTSYIDVPTHDV